MNANKDQAGKPPADAAAAKSPRDKDEASKEALEQAQAEAAEEREDEGGYQ